MPLPEPKKLVHTVVHHTQTALHHAKKINPRRALRIAIGSALLLGIAGALILAILFSLINKS